MTSYGQFCPIAKAMEILDERWTILIVRELLQGSHHFNDLRRGVPKMSPALLSKRLRTLERSGLVVRRTDGNRVRYDLSAAGKELAPIIDALGGWGLRWCSSLGDEDLDPHLLMWDIHRNLDLDVMPSGRVVIGFRFVDVAASAREWFLVVEDQSHVDVCDFDPGYETTVAVTSTLRTLTELWRGDISWRQATRHAGLQVTGPTTVRRDLPRWLKLSAFAAVPGPRGSMTPPEVLAGA